MKAEQLKLFLASPESTVVEAMQQIDSNARGLLFVVDENRKLSGVLTDGDIRRWLIKTGNLQADIVQRRHRQGRIRPIYITYMIYNNGHVTLPFTEHRCRTTHPTAPQS